MAQQVTEMGKNAHVLQVIQVIQPRERGGVRFTSPPLREKRKKKKSEMGLTTPLWKLREKSTPKSQRGWSVKVKKGAISE